MQTPFNTEQTLDSKIAFEGHADTCGVKIASYRADNGRFAEKSFRDTVEEAQQSIDFCATGAHHQNGVIERHFQTLSPRSRTILLHAKRFWHGMVSQILWPFAYKYAEYLHNHLNLDEDLKTPVETFCGSDGKIEIKNLHTWGFPFYVIDARAQSGNMVPRFEPCSRLGIYLGHSPCHEGSVALVLNQTTLHVSPQFHVAFDNYFTTVPILATRDIPPNWEKLVRASESSTDKKYDLAKYLLAANVKVTAEDLSDQEGDSGSQTVARKKVSFAEDIEKDNNGEALLQQTLPDLNDMS